MIISGIQKLTLLDYPGKVACIVFIGGCNYRCGFCHNPEFVLPEMLTKIRGSFIPEETALNFLRRRQGMLSGVVVSGGEPTVMPDLIPFIGHIRALGYDVKLDTNGNRPDVLRSLLGRDLVQYVAMDFKTSFPRYRELVGSGVDAQALKESIDLLKEGNVDYEFRSTLIREVHTPEILEEMQETMRGAKRLFLQTFRNGVTLHPRFREYHPFGAEEMEHIAERFREGVANVGIRSE